MTEDLRQEFHSQLDEIGNDLVRMTGDVIEAINRSTQVLQDLDLAKAREVIEGDDAIDALALDLEERCATLLALQAPLASDLRGVLVALWLVAEIERCGDLASNLSKAARRLYGGELPASLRSLQVEMGAEATSLLRLAIDSYTDRDASVAAALGDLDDRLDRLHRRWLATIFEAHRDGCLEVEPGVQLALVGRYYERIGDHAVNIGHRVVYLVTGWLPEHTGAARAEARRHLHGVDALSSSPVGLRGSGGTVTADGPTPPAEGAEEDG